MTGRHVMISTLPAIQDLKVLWDETGGPWAGFTLLAGEDRCDVAVIGDGFTGLSATLRLAIDGAKVSLIDADTIGFRASGRNGGQIVPGLKPRADSAISNLGAGGGAAATTGEEEEDEEEDIWPTSLNEASRPRLPRHGRRLE